MNDKCIERCPVVLETMCVLQSPDCTPELSEAGYALLEQLASGCATDGAGPLTMQASREDVTYRVTVCASNEIPMRKENENPEPVTIVRQAQK